MVEFIHDVGMSEEKAEFVRNDKIRTEVFIPLEKRIAREKPELVVSLQKLQDYLLQPSQRQVLKSYFLLS